MHQSMIEFEHEDHGGGFCDKHGLLRLIGWGTYECPLCELAREDACACGGTGRCEHRPYACPVEACCDGLCCECCPDS